MKSTIAILLLLTIGATLAQNDKCNTAMITALLTQNGAEGPKESADEPDIPTITPLATPVTTGYDAEEVCGKYWTAQGGSCCNQAELKARIDKMVARTTKRAGKRKAAFKDGKTEGLDKSQSLEDEIDARNAQLKDGSQGTAATDAEIADWKTKIQSLKAGAGKDTQRQKDAESKGPSCQKKLIDIRIKTWCLACGATTDAGIAEVWDSATNTIKVHEDTCKEIVEECAATIGFAKRMRQFEVISRKVTQATGGTQVDGANPDEPLEPEAELEADVACGDDAEACKGDATKRKDLCQKVSLNQDDTKIWGDGKLGKSKPEGLPPRNPPPAIRILASGDAYGYPAEQSAGSGWQEGAVDSGYPLTNSQFGGEDENSSANMVSIVSMLVAIALFAF